jgi:hypothetical protein
MKKRLLQGLALFALNALFCFPLFRTRYLDDFQSNEGYWIAIARFLTGHWPHVAWLPWFDAGKPLEAAYLPLVETLTALGAWLTHASPALAFHVLAALAYCLAPVSLFAFAAWVSGRTAGAFSAALLWSLFSPSVMLPKILADSGSVWVLRRLNNIVFYGEVPHNVAIALVPLALLALARYLKQPAARRFAVAALAFAAAMVSNAFGVVLAGVSAMLLLAAEDRPDWRHVLALGGIVAAAYLLVCRVLPPSLVKLIETNSQTVGGDFRFTPRTALLAAAAALALAVLWWLTRRIAGAMPRFSLLFLAWFGGIPILGACGIVLIPQPNRYHLEMEIGVCLVAGFAVEAVARRLPRKAWLAAAAVCAAFLLWVGAKDYAFSRRLIRPADAAHSAVYRQARWIAGNLPGARVMASGEASLWLNLFADNPQLSGGFEVSDPNWMQRVAVYTIYSGQGAGDRDAAISVFWLKAFGCAAVTVPALDSSDHYHPIVNPRKFDGVLPLAWREGPDSIYRVPLRSASLAHVIPRAAMVTRTPIHGLDLDPARAYVAALDDATLPLASMEWETPDHVRIAALLADGQAIAVQEAYDPGWRATAEGRPLRVREDGLGLMVLEPDRTGPVAIDLRFEGGTERNICAAVSAAMALALFGMLVWPWAARLRPASRP